MKIKYIKDHIGQGAVANQEVEVADDIAKHLIRFGYAEESGLQQLAKIEQEVYAHGDLKDGFNKPKGNVRSGQARA